MMPTAIMAGPFHQAIGMVYLSSSPDKMIRLVGLENLVMNHGMALEGIGKNLHALMHHEAMQGPFKE